MLRTLPLAKGNAHHTGAHVVGVRAEAEAREQLKPGYNRFLAENDPALKNEAGQDLIRAIFGTDAIAEDAVR